MSKFVERLRSRPVSSTAIGFAAVLVLGGTVAAITSPDFTYTTTRTGYYTISALDLTPTSRDGTYAVSLLQGKLVADTDICFSTE